MSQTRTSHVANVQISHDSGIAVLDPEAKLSWSPLSLDIYSTKNYMIGTQLSMFGWGVRRSLKRRKWLGELSISMFDSSICYDRLGMDVLDEVCTWDKVSNRFAYHMDKGSALVTKDRTTLVGLKLQTVGLNSPTTFTRIAYYKDWIDSTLVSQFQ
ncbi:hypothetical protein DSO57_1023419 [Entomophthora muscae]|uniref:Uncharacterized protein n=1 Tax=Entomophthora muscae TaxID=34485 RepID=A0ACC2SRS9_9FUNG|nr:hypothetical protein DSO57_1023419 [Entomophthora muscae]